MQNHVFLTGIGIDDNPSMAIRNFSPWTGAIGAVAAVLPD